MNNSIKYHIFKAIIIFVAISFVDFNQVSAQSLRKLYKYISNSEINKATEEVKEFTKLPLKNNEENVEYNLAKCILVCNKNYIEYAPYASLELYISTINTVYESNKVDEFLSKRGLNIKKNEDTIYQSVFAFAKGLNTEDSYKKALGVCDKCSYLEEVTRLKENAAYIEAIIKNTVYGYKYYLSCYKSPDHVLEIKNKLYNCLRRFKT